MIITIDGPSGTGKSTIADRLAKRLGFQCLHTGSIYRWITHHVLDRGVSCDDEPAIVRIAQELDFLNIDHAHTHTKHVTEHVTQVGKLPNVRACVRTVQHAIAHAGDTVVEGRDIGTVVFPQAECKFYLNASADIRAERRWNEYRSKGVERTLEDVRASITKRDEDDATRTHSPLKKAEDALEIDTGRYTIEEELDLMEAYVNTKRSSTNT